MTDDLNNLDIEDDDDVVMDKTYTSDDNFDPDTYTKPYMGTNGEPEPDIQTSESEPEDEDDLITAFLKSKGIKDTTSIKMESEDGSIEFFIQRRTIKYFIIH